VVVIELGNRAGKQAEKQHCKLEHVMEREREREETAKGQRSNASMSFCDGAAIAGLSSSPGPTIALHPLPSSFLFPGQQSRATTGHRYCTRKANILSSTPHTLHEIPLQNS
jgi:hypothetical protein